MAKYLVETYYTCNFKVSHYLEDINESIQAYHEAIKINKNFTKAHKNLGIILQEKGELKEASKCFKKVYDLDDSAGDALINYWHLKQFCCEWNGHHLMKKQIIDFLNNYKDSNDSEPCRTFPLLSMFDDPDLHFKASNLYAQKKVKKKKYFSKKNIIEKNKKIKIAYISDDFRNHPSSYLSAGMFENHSKDDFEIFLAQRM